MDIIKVINKFYYELSIYELKLMSDNKSFSNISHTTILYLNIIAFKEKCTVSMIAKLLNITKSAVTIKVNELVKKGYVKKIQSKQDKRIFYLKISDEVKDIFDKYDSIFFTIQDKMKENFSVEQIKNFYEIIEFISKCSSEEK